MNEKTRHVVNNDNVIYSNLNGGYSAQTEIRATNQTIGNIKVFLKDK
jgi:hypothetical protein